MTKLEAVNAVLRKATGHEIVPVTPPAEPVKFRPPADPALDRLLVRPVFIMAPVRSGSTLLRVLLGNHSRLHAPHELHLHHVRVTPTHPLAGESLEVLGLDVADLEHLLWDRVLHRELTRAGKEFIVDKTPSNAFKWRRISACWPDARFIFLLRHPGSVAYSWYNGARHARTLDGSADYTLRFMRAVERARKNLPGHTVRYEELSEDPAAVLRGVCEYLEVDFEPGMVTYSAEPAEFRRGLGDWGDKIRSGRVQAGRELPPDFVLPEALRKITEAWGYSAVADSAPIAQ